ncbi:hypothetical protein SOVF_071230 [Spinacia oleracea]|nr:hypothetical protein SOVF_071230 [Spinacia oleracea]
MKSKPSSTFAMCLATSGRSAIASHLSGSTNNEIKNFWNTHLKKKLLQIGIDHVTHRPRTDLNLLANLPQLLMAVNLRNSLMMNNSTGNGIPTLEDTLRLLESDATQLAKFHIFNKLQVKPKQQLSTYWGL